MNYSKAFLRFIPFLILPVIFIVIDNYSGRKVNYIIYAVAFVLLAFLALIIFVKSRGVKNIFQNGIKGKAELIKVEDTGVQINFKPQLLLYLNVTMPGKAPFEVKHHEAIDNWNITRLQPGAEFNILADPENLSNIIIKWSK